MKSALFLRHVTLTTGHVNDSYRSDVSDEAVAYCRALIDQAIAGEEDDVRIPIPAMLGVSMSVISTTRSLMCALWYEDQRIVQFGVATHSRAGASLWRVLTEVNVQMPIAVDISQCPPEPWVAARLEPAIGNCAREIIMAIGDFERCVAWAFIETVESRH